MKCTRAVFWHLHPYFLIERDEARRRQFDVAVLVLKHPVGRRSGWHTVALTR